MPVCWVLSSPNSSAPWVTSSPLTSKVCASADAGNAVRAIRLTAWTARRWQGIGSTLQGMAVLPLAATPKPASALAGVGVGAAPTQARWGADGRPRAPRPKGPPPGPGTGKPPENILLQHPANGQVAGAPPA